MNANDKIMRRIEDALREQPWCTCGAATAPVAHGDDIWLECRTLGEPRRGIGRLLAAVSPHLRVPVVDGELAAAA